MFDVNYDLQFPNFVITSCFVFAMLPVYEKILRCIKMSKISTNKQNTSKLMSTLLIIDVIVLKIIQNKKISLKQIELFITKRLDH